MKAKSALAKDTAMADENDDEADDWGVSLVAVPRVPTAKEKNQQLMEAHL